VNTVAELTVELLDDDEMLVKTLRVESDETYVLNSWFTAPDGGVYVVCGVRAGEPPTETVLAARWFDGPHPRRR
jgi:hypothetical protein